MSLSCTWVVSDGLFPHFPVLWFLLSPFLVLLSQMLNQLICWYDAIVHLMNFCWRASYTVICIKHWRFLYIGVFFVCAGEIRRIRAPGDFAQYSLTELYSWIEAKPEDGALYWLDEENDRIIIRTEMDLQECFSSYHKSSVTVPSIYFDRRPVLLKQLPIDQKSPFVECDAPLRSSAACADKAAPASPVTWRCPVTAAPAETVCSDKGRPTAANGFFSCAAILFGTSIVLPNKLQALVLAAVILMAALYGPNSVPRMLLRLFRHCADK